MAHKVIVPPKKNYISRSFLNSGTLIVIIGEAERRGGGGALLAWLTTAASSQITMEIYISDWTHKFHHKTGLDAKANSELYKSNRVNSAIGKTVGLFIYSLYACCKTTVYSSSPEPIVIKQFHNKEGA